MQYIDEKVKRIKQAVRSCDLAQVKTMIAEQGSGEYLERTALQVAIQYQRTEIALYLIETGSYPQDLLLTCYQGFPPLQYAAMVGPLEVVQAFVNKGADVNLVCQAGTALHFVLDRTFADEDLIESIALYLISQGADISAVNPAGQTPLYIAVSRRVKISVIAKLITPTTIDALTNNGMSPLQMAARMGNDPSGRCIDEVVALLLAEGASTGLFGGPNGNSPLHLACESGHLRVAEAIVGCGSALDVRDASNETPLHAAILHKNSQLALYLLTCGAGVGPSAAGKHGMTPLLLACKGHMTNVAKALVLQGAELNAVDMFGNTALYHAQQAGSKQLAILLRERGATLQEDTFSFAFL